jgi:hypothetical protein
MVDRIKYELSDVDNDLASFGIDVPSTFTLAQYTEFVRAKAVLLDAIVSGLISRASLRRAIDLSGLTGNTGLSTSDREDVGNFVFRTAAFRKVVTRVPGIIEGLVLSNSDDLDQADTDVAAFISAMLNGISVTGGTISPSDVAEDDIIAIEEASERFRSSGRR